MEYKPNDDMLKKIAEDLEETIPEEKRERVKKLIYLNKLFQTCPDYRIETYKEDKNVICNVISNNRNTGAPLLNAGIIMLSGAMQGLELTPEEVAEFVNYCLNRDFHVTNATKEEK